MHKMRFLLAAACLVLASCLNVRVLEGRPGDIEFSTQDTRRIPMWWLMYKSYFLNDAPVAALNTLFPPTTSFYLPFTSSYTDLEKAGRKSRWEIPLGLTPLDNAITALWEGGDSKAARSLLVATQMVLEAAKSILVEQRVRDSIQDKGDFVPDAGILANREF
ncbi:abrin-b-like [Pyrus ussuriensis x Pyrus communis]|uniref:rRNA N-glycosylase n=1 Tax=Pyrus ussuriensis x Pyrus communis TaxID=2448454 RepID=A0A5N5HB78_9ROSA|nr:abrin-b-like [Pyrus ussuriensis x Pyrus communis]